MTFSFKQFTGLKEAVSSVTRDEFLDAMKSVYDSGDERLVRRITELGADIQIDEVCARIFKIKAPKADAGSDATLANKIKQLGITSQEKVELVYAIEAGTAYDIMGLAKSARSAPVDIKTCVNSKIAGATELLPWYSEWKAKPDSSARGSASNEIWMITAGKDGKTPAKGDVQLGTKFIESKSSAKKTFEGEFSISGKQNSYIEPTGKFKAGLAALFKQKKITMDNEDNYGLSGSKTKGMISGNASKPVATALQKTIDALMKEGKMKANAVDSALQKLIKDSFPNANTTTSSVMNGNSIDIKKFYLNWVACAFDEYAAEEGFDLMMMFSRGSDRVKSFYSGADVMKLGDNFKCMIVTYNRGAGQNNSLADLHYS